MNIHESGEDYLEAILKLKQEHGTVRSIDIARELNYSKPSVSRAMGILKERGLIHIEEREITLTEEGMKIAERIYGRHRFLQKFLCELGVDPQTAENDACRMEHVLSEDSYQKLKQFVEEHRGQLSEAEAVRRGAPQTVSDGQVREKIPDFFFMCARGETENRRIR